MALAMGVPLAGKRAGGSKRAWRAGVRPPPTLSELSPLPPDAWLTAP